VDEIAGCLEIPECTEGVHSVLLAPLHKLLVTLVVRGDKYNFSIPGLVDFSQYLKGVRSAFSGFGVPKDASLGAEIVVDERRNGRTEGFLHITSDPDQEPVGGLEACGESCAETSTGTHTDTSLVDGRGVGNASELELASPDVSGHVVDKAPREVTLDTADQVMVFRMSPLADYAECMELLDRRTRDTGE